MASESALIVGVPAAEPVVGRHRLRYDMSAARGVPAHVTVLYPFVPPALLDASVTERLGQVVESVPRFTVAFRRTQWFEQRVLWLEPAPDGPFRALTAAVFSAFPAYPPYGGRYPDGVPHLTVGDSGTKSQLAEVERVISRQLPIWMDVSAVSLITGSLEPHSWTTQATFRLG